jgi:hypothetical protein
MSSIDVAHAITSAAATGMALLRMDATNDTPSSTTENRHEAASAHEFSGLPFHLLSPLPIGGPNSFELE